MICPECDSPMEKVGGRYGDYLRCIGWPNCDVSLSLHSDGTPMGTPANKETRYARRMLHEQFDSIWMRLQLVAWSRLGYRKDRAEARSQMYDWLAGQMGMSAKECHIGNFTLSDCKAAEQLIKSITAQQIMAWAAPYDWKQEVSLPA